MKLLLEKGSDYDANSDKRFTPLFFASLNGHLEIAKNLIEKGADIEVKDVYGCKFTSYFRTNFHKEEIRKFIEDIQSRWRNSKRRDKRFYRGHPPKKINDKTSHSTRDTEGEISIIAEILFSNWKRK